jgi:hypothetical protein
LSDLNGKGPVTPPPIAKELLCNDPPSLPDGGVAGGFSNVCMISLKGLESLIFPAAIADACDNALPLVKCAPAGFVGDSSTGDFNRPTWQDIELLAAAAAPA